MDYGGNSDKVLPMRFDFIALLKKPEWAEPPRLITEVGVASESTLDSACIFRLLGQRIAMPASGTASYWPVPNTRSLFENEATSVVLPLRGPALREVLSGGDRCWRSRSFGATGAFGGDTWPAGAAPSADA